jgi:hypothetical protein
MYHVAAAAAYVSALMACMQLSYCRTVTCSRTNIAAALAVRIVQYIFRCKLHTVKLFHQLSVEAAACQLATNCRVQVAQTRNSSHLAAAELDPGHLDRSKNLCQIVFGSYNCLHVRPGGGHVTGGGSGYTVPDCMLSKHGPRFCNLHVSRSPCRVTL